MTTAAVLADMTDQRVKSLQSISAILEHTEQRDDIPDAAFRHVFVHARNILELDEKAMTRLVGISRPTIWRWERGKSAPYPPIRPKVLEALREEAQRKLRFHDRLVV